MRGFRRDRLTFAAIGAVGALMLPALSHAQLYSQDFEPPVPTSSTPATFGGFGQINDISGTGWQVQGGGGGGGISVVAGVDANGVGGSQALFANFDHSLATDFTFNQYTVYGAVNPPGAGTATNLIRIEADVFVSGSESSNTPVEVVLINGGTEMGGYFPTLTNGQYTHVSVLVSQLNNEFLFDPTMSSSLRFQHGAGGFGFDADNIVRIDNIVVSVVPEPATMGLIASSGLLALRRRRRA